MNKKFNNVPLDSDTTILEQKEIKINNLDALHQIWNWDGLKGESLIFCNEDFSEISQDELIEKCQKTKLLEHGSTPTYKKNSNGFTFVNFNFKS